MKNILVTFCLCFSISTGALCQKKFREKYDTFRFKLYPQLEQTQPFSISRDMAESIESFLQENEKGIVGFRKTQLEQYERESMEEKSAYTTLNDTDLKTIRDHILHIDLENIKSQVNKQHHQFEDYESIKAMVVLLSVDPVSAIWMASAQVSSLVLMDNLGMAVEELTNLYGKIGIGGTYLSTEELDNTRWIVTLNNYYLIYRFSVEIDSGDIKLLTVKTRNF